MIEKACCRSTGQPAPPGGIRAPEWVGAPPRPAHLHVLKDGQVIQSIPLQQPATLFGRSSSFIPLRCPSKDRQIALSPNKAQGREPAYCSLKHCASLQLLQAVTFTNVQYIAGLLQQMLCWIIPPCPDSMQPSAITGWKNGGWSWI